MSFESSFYVIGPNQLSYEKKKSKMCISILIRIILITVDLSFYVRYLDCSFLTIQRTVTVKER
jgi:hypothetical protein